MKTAVLFSPRDTRAVEVAEPSLAPHEHVVRPEAVGSCSTDVQVYRGT